MALFFIPFLNLLFFLVLCLLPEADGAPAEAKATPPRDSRLALTNYGWGLFVALPFTLGFASAVIYGMRQPRSLASWVWVAGLSTRLLGAALLALAFEGVICLLMVAPLALPLAAFGGAGAYLVQRRRRFDTEAPALLSILLCLCSWCRMGRAFHNATPQICCSHRNRHSGPT